MNKQNQEHLNNPKPGDYWHEMFSPICVVIEVRAHEVTVCSTTISTDGDDEWTWDLSKRAIMSRSDFEKWLTYDSNPGVTWCNVSPEKHKWAVETRIPGVYS